MRADAQHQKISAAKAKSNLLADLLGQGFDACAVTTPDAIVGADERLAKFLEQGRQGTMAWMAETQERRGHPNALWSEAESVVMVAMSYAPADSNDPLEALKKKNSGTISVYAQNRDYHDVMKGMLKQVAGRFASRTGADVKVFVDTAPLMEKPLAAAAGLGWQGKHTNLVSRELGSWFFLGAILTDMKLEPDQAEIDHCGSCRACLDICPTSAFPAPYQLDARRCISYLTIEHAGAIPREFRALMGNRIYGCDDCLAACPWNKFADESRHLKLKALEERISPGLAKLLDLDDRNFREKFAGSPIKRIGRNRFIRNVLIAVGNSGEPSYIEKVIGLLADEAPVVRGAAVWALSQIAAPDLFKEQWAGRGASEPDAGVRSEWDSALEEIGETK